jgi:hypothetical protein
MVCRAIDGSRVVLRTCSQNDRDFQFELLDFNVRMRDPPSPKGCSAPSLQDFGMTFSAFSIDFGTGVPNMNMGPYPLEAYSSPLSLLSTPPAVEHEAITPDWPALHALFDHSSSPSTIELTPLSAANGHAGTSVGPSSLGLEHGIHSSNAIGPMLESNMPPFVHVSNSLGLEPEPSALGLLSPASAQLGLDPSALNVPDAVTPTSLPLPSAVLSPVTFTSLSVPLQAAHPLLAAALPPPLDPGSSSLPPSTPYPPQPEATAPMPANPYFSQLKSSSKIVHGMSHAPPAVQAIYAEPVTSSLSYRSVTLSKHVFDTNDELFIDGSRLLRVCAYPGIILKMH